MRRLLLVGGLLAFSAVATAAPAADYIGESKCKVCHKIQSESWLSTKHAKALEVLKPEERAKAECLECHATGGRAELAGVQCEACHGPGSDYKAIPVMKDRAKAQSAGLVVPDEALCKSCHEKAPHKVPEFAFETAKAQGTHAHKPK